MSSATLSSPTAISSLLPLRTQIPCNTTRRRRLRFPCPSKPYHRAVAALPDPSEGTRPEYTPWLIAGLGNPGNKYHGTRHNVGFEMIDHISRAESITLNTIQSKALIGIGSIGPVPVLLVKPQSYMNYSGESVGPLAAYYQVPLRHILLIYDEMSLPNGVLRAQQKGGHGHHNGVKSVIQHLDDCRDFPRLCIGIGNPPGIMDMRAFLLQKFSTKERAQMDSALEQGVLAVRALVLKGFSRSIDRFNLVQKYNTTKFETVSERNFEIQYKELQSMFNFSAQAEIYCLQIGGTIAAVYNCGYAIALIYMTISCKCF